MCLESSKSFDTVKLRKKCPTGESTGEPLPINIVGQLTLVC